ncbi:DUF397 domain-containing protein [Microbispora rosea]|uniref:DUF397 domain-containing protein n=1 Tax=Microbispora rosea TaxID=58117 RepID=UPI0004C447AC|nr:DUF397 domain-containing protein [Microbispora rosea]
MESPQGAGRPALEWRTSSRCTGGDCVQVAFTDDGVVMRDSKNPERGSLFYSRDEWRAFVAMTKANFHDLP